MMSDAFNRATRGFGFAAFFFFFSKKKQVVIADACGEPHCVEEGPQLSPVGIGNLYRNTSSGFRSISQRQDPTAQAFADYRAQIPRAITARKALRVINHSRG